MNNPFTPTFGIVPNVLAGRDTILREMRRAFANGHGDPNLSSILIGPRGSGKTAMLSCIGDEATQEGWIVADVIAVEGMLDDILQRTSDAAAEFIGKREKRHLTGVSIGSFLGLSWSTENKYAANWRTRITEMLRELNNRDIGLLITVDEVSADVTEMIQLASTYQLLIREGAKVSLVMAGLPSNVGNLITDEKVSFLRRARQKYIGNISDADIRSAMRETISNGGKDIESKALDAAVEASGGYAYMMQLVGYQMWDVSGGRKSITYDDAVQGIKYAKSDFRSGVLDNTYRELSDGDIAFLFTMLKDEAGSSVSDIAKRLGKSTGYVSTYKKRLLQAGVIEGVARSRVDFAIPGFREYLKDLDG